MPAEVIDALHALVGAVVGWLLRMLRERWAKGGK